MELHGNKMKTKIINQLGNWGITGVRARVFIASFERYLAGENPSFEFDNLVVRWEPSRQKIVSEWVIEFK